MSAIEAPPQLPDLPDLDTMIQGREWVEDVLTRPEA